jgi:glycosyltransferase involved in cell wall biosynthesis
MDFYLLGWLSFIVTSLQIRPLLQNPKRTGRNSKNSASISIIVPCRNEESNIGEFLEAATRLSPPALEIIVVDDHSTDSTSSIAKSYPGIIVVESPPLPPTWIGQNWACSFGASKAEGDYLLFTDADTRLDVKALERSNETMVGQSLQFISAVPQIQCKSYWEYIQGAFWMIILGVSHHPIWKLHFCIGQFLLFERLSYEQMGGHTSIKDSPAEDLAIMKIALKRGYKYNVCPHGLYKVRMYNKGFVSFVNGWVRILRLGLMHSNFASLVISFFFVMHLGLPVVDGVRHLLGREMSASPLVVVSSFIVSTLFIQFGARRILTVNHWMNWVYPLAFLLFLYLTIKTSIDKLRHKPLYWRSREIPG